MIDPIISLAFTLTSNKGCYALLLGSGISHSAHIPTGWDITLDLIKKIARLSGEDVADDPVSWFEKKFNKKADYSILLEALTNVPSERSNLLAEYFDPNDEERKKGWKLPTQAHNAIAELVAGEYFKVIITTNFDKLLEKAFDARGLQPKVISNADAIEGSIPLVHMKRPLILKVNGDYLDTRIKNTEKELSSYDPRISKLLSRIFEDFGVITCGWSGTYDKELIKLFSNQNNMFNCFWIDKYPPNDNGKKLIEKKKATFIQKDGDELFTELAQRVLHFEDDDSFVKAKLNVQPIPKKPSEIIEFVQPESSEELRQNRLKIIASGKDNPQLIDKPKLILHLIPESTIKRKNRFKLNKLTDEQRTLDPIGFDPENKSNKFSNVTNYASILQNGSIEAVNASILMAGLKFPIDEAEQMIIKTLTHYFKLFVDIKLKPPVHLLVSLVGVRGFEIIPAIKTDWNTGFKIKTNEVLCPGVVFKRFPKYTSLEQLRPAFIHVWKSAGFKFGS
jgi:SIR2-like domain